MLTQLYHFTTTATVTGGAEWASGVNRSINPFISSYGPCYLSHAVQVVTQMVRPTTPNTSCSALQFGSGLTPSQLSTIHGSTQNFVTWLIKQAAMPVLTGLRPTPWSAARDRLGLPRASSTCPVVDEVLRLMGHSVKKCDVILNAILVGWSLWHWLL